MLFAGCAAPEQAPADWRTSSLSAFGPPARVEEWKRLVPELDAGLAPERRIFVGIQAGSGGPGLNGWDEVTVRAVKLRVGDLEFDPEGINGHSIISWNGGSMGGGAKLIPLVDVPVAEAPGGPTMICCLVDVEALEFGSAHPDSPVVIARFQKWVSTTFNMPPGLVPRNVRKSQAKINTRPATRTTP
jgi:hypothetical protein